MKNFKKLIFLSIIIVGVIALIIYKLNNSEKYEEIEYENVYSMEEVEETKEGEKSFIILHIAGAVANPGIIKIEEGSRVADAINAAGGTTQNADLNKINLAYVLSDGQKLYIPSVEDNEEEYIIQDIGSNIIEDNKVNINTATQSELESLTGIGPSTALKIIEYRKENGKFKNIEEIKNVPGIGENKFKQIENQIYV